MDGTTQPGYAGKPLVRVDGSWAAGAIDGIKLYGGCTLKGLSITGFGMKWVCTSMIPGSPRARQTRRTGSGSATELQGSTPVSPPPQQSTVHPSCSRGYRHTCGCTPKILARIHHIASITAAPSAPMPSATDVVRRFDGSSMNLC